MTTVYVLCESGRPLPLLVLDAPVWPGVLPADAVEKKVFATGRDSRAGKRVGQWSSVVTGTTFHLIAYQVTPALVSETPLCDQ